MNSTLLEFASQFCIPSPLLGVDSWAPTLPTAPSLPATPTLPAVRGQVHVLEALVVGLAVGLVAGVGVLRQVGVSQRACHGTVRQRMIHRA